MLSDTEIKAEVGKGVVIIPYSPSQVRCNSYDIRLGEHFYVERETPGNRYADYDIYDEKDVMTTWKYVHPPIATEGKFKGRRVLWLAPRERVLGHTEEFIGGRGRLTTMIKTRSSLGRSGLSTCLCAGSGDVGYVNRWALEITNHLRFHRVPLVVGEPIAQMLFLRTGECEKPYAGKYQEAAPIDELVARWKPEMVLPRLYEDAARWASEAPAPAAISGAAPAGPAAPAETAAPHHGAV